VEDDDHPDLAAGLPADQPQRQGDAEAPDQECVRPIDRQRDEADDGQSEEEQDGEQAALRLDPGEPQQLLHPRKAR
jgi:hypothetical protein